jgi:hypothetical protein
MLLILVGLRVHSTHAEKLNPTPQLQLHSSCQVDALAILGFTAKVEIYIGILSALFNATKNACSL